MTAWFAGLGPLAVARPAPSLGRAVAGAGGAMSAVGVVALGGDRWASSGSSALAVVLVGALLAAGVAAAVRMPPPLAVAGVGASGVAAPALAFFLTAGGGFPSIREVAVLAGLLLGGLYGVGPWRGHTFHLAILVAAVWVAALSLGDLGIERSLFGGFGTLGDAVSGAGAASMVVGVVYLGLGSWLHDAGLRGMATPFLAVAALALPIGAFALLRDSPAALLGLVATAVGAAVALVGARCGRRGSTWVGVAVGAFGVVNLVDGLPGDTVVESLLLAAAGAGLVFLAPMASALVREPFPDPVLPGADRPSKGAEPPDPSVPPGQPGPVTPAGPVTAPETAELSSPPEPGPSRARRPRPVRPPGSPRTPRAQRPPRPLPPGPPPPPGPEQ